MNVVAAETRDPALVHRTLHEVVPLHPILVSGAIGEVRESCFTDLVFFQLPEVLQIAPLVESHRPVVVLALDRVVEGLSLRVALNAGIVRAHGVQLRRVHDCLRRWPSHVFTAWTVAALAPDVPFSDSLR